MTTTAEPVKTPRLDRHGFPFMQDILPEGQSGECHLRHYTVSEIEAELYNMRVMFQRWPYWMRLRAGDYVKLIIQGDLWMSDTPMERHTNQDIVIGARGDVLIGGLGLGMIPSALLLPDSKYHRTDIRSVTVIEKNPDVIALIAPHLTYPNLRILEADVFTWKPDQKFDTIYMDIWSDISSDNVPEIARLHRRYGRYLNRNNPGHCMSSWLVSYVRKMRRKQE